MYMDPKIITLLFLDLIFVLFGTVAFINACKITLFYDADATTPQQYTLEKQSYLSATIIRFIFLVKIPLFIFFIYTLDSLAAVIPGAMCAAGVVTATPYGTPLLFLKILNLYLFAFWIVLNSEDMRHEAQPYLSVKFLLYCAAYLLLMAEIVTEIVLFTSLDIGSVVDCCGVLFSATNSSYLALLLHLKETILLSIFYGLFVLLVVSYLKKAYRIYAIANIFYLIISVVTLIAFFGTYIYEQPSHHCPFCLLQGDYHYIGYFLYTALFIGTFNGVAVGLVRFSKEKRFGMVTNSLLFNTLYLIAVSCYPLFYYMHNGVWLK